MAGLIEVVRNGALRNKKWRASTIWTMQGRFAHNIRAFQLSNNVQDKRLKCTQKIPNLLTVDR